MIDDYQIVMTIAPENDGCKSEPELVTVGSLILRIRRNIMTRWLLAVGCVLTLVILAFANTAEARGYTRKKCIPPDRAQTFVCSASEKCCYDYVLRKGACTADRCF